MKKRPSVFLLCSVLVFFASPAESEDTPPPDPAAEKIRHWTLTIPLWLPGYRGEFAIGDLEVGGESPGGPELGRLVESDVQLNFFFMGSLAYAWDAWRIHGDVFGGQFTDDVTYTLNDATVVNASLTPIIPRLHLEYRVLDHDWGESATRRVRGWAYGGVRYYNVGAEVNLPERSESLTARWADPIIGVRIPVDLSRRWRVELSGDIGGFGVGSKFSWAIYGGITYRFGQLVSLTLAYNYLNVDYSGTVGSEEFRWQARVGGPGLGLRFDF